MDKYNAIVTQCDIKDETKKGSLSHLKIALKDNISTKGVKTTASSKILENYTPVFNATVVDKIIQAGGHIVAKTTMDELGMGGYGKNPATGPTLNAIDQNRMAGGSSAGSAVLVASGVVDVALGTDTGDSMRIPASYNGIVGLKPTYGRVSRYGVVPYAASLDHVGIFAKDIKTVATMLEVIAGYDRLDQVTSHKEVERYSDLDSDVNDVKIAILDNVLNEIDNEEIIGAFYRLVNALDLRYSEVKTVSMDEDLFKALPIVYKIIANAEAFSNHSNLSGVPFGNRIAGDTLSETILKTRSNGFSFQVAQRMFIGATTLMSENYTDVYVKAQKVRRKVVDNLNEMKEDYDFIIAPAASRIAPLLSEDEDEHATLADSYMVMDNFSGHPGIVIPLGTSESMPFGLYISTRAFNEKQLLSFAAIIEEMVGEL